MTMTITVDQPLVEAATALLKAHYPDSGGIAAAMYTREGDILTGVVFDPEWGGGGLCAETGPILEAVKRKTEIAATVCVGRLEVDSPIMILTPCGICQERLFHFGAGVYVAVPDTADPTRWQAKTLAEVQPHYWVNAYR
jgi:cytidine deaminase